MPPLIRALRPQEWIKNLLVFAGVLFSGRLDEGERGGRRAAHLRRLLRRSRAPATCSTTCATASTTAATPRSATARSPAARSRRRPPAALARGARRRRDRARLRGRGRGRRPRRALRRDHDRLLAGPQAAGDHRRDDDRLAVHPAGGRRRGRGRRPRLGVPARSAPGCSPSSSASPSAARRRCWRRRRARTPDTRPVLEHYSLPFLDQMIAMVTASAIISYIIYAVDSPRSGRRCSPPRPRCSTGSSATCT